MPARALLSVRILCGSATRRGLAAASFAMLVGCSAVYPGPRLGPPPPADSFVEAAYPPPPARVEITPKRPLKRAVWVDGQWTWGRKWSWHPGGWVDPKPGALYTPWVAVRRGDGALLFAPAAWRDANGNQLEPPPYLSRAHTGDPSLEALREEELAAKQNAAGAAHAEMPLARPKAPSAPANATSPDGAVRRVPAEAPPAPAKPDVPATPAAPDSSGTSVDAPNN